MKVGKHGDGGGLWLFRREDGGAQWSFRYTLYGRAREIGLGSARDLTLKDAREVARRWRSVVAAGDDPKEVRERERQEKARKRPTFEMVMAEAFEARKAKLKDDGRAGRWDSPLRLHVLPKMGKVPVEKIDGDEIKRVLRPIWHEKPDVARKAMNRIGIVLKYGAAKKLSVDLQAVDNAKQLLGEQRHESKNIPSLPYEEVPAFVSSLGDTMAERAMRLLILTACRSGEIRGAHLSEFDLGAAIWEIPAERMKGGKSHRVPLTRDAIKAVEDAAQFERGGFLFPGARKGVISDMTLTAYMRRRDMDARPHGFRASFRTWAAEVATDFPREVAEACLAHVTAKKTEKSYQRSDLLERRRPLMAKWADHVAGRSGEVLKLAEATK